MDRALSFTSLLLKIPTSLRSTQPRAFSLRTARVPQAAEVVFESPLKTDQFCQCQGWWFCWVFFFFAGASNAALRGGAKQFNTGTIFPSQRVGSLGRLIFTLNI